MLAGKGTKAGLKRALWIKWTNGKAVRSLVASVDWSSWPWRDLIRVMTCPVRNIAMQVQVINLGLKCPVWPVFLESGAEAGGAKCTHSQTCICLGVLSCYNSLSLQCQNWAMTPCNAEVRREESHTHTHVHACTQISALPYSFMKKKNVLMFQRYTLWSQ